MHNKEIHKISYFQNSKAPRILRGFVCFQNASFQISQNLPNPSEALNCNLQRAIGTLRQFSSLFCHKSERYLLLLGVEIHIATECGGGKSQRKHCLASNNGWIELAF